ncbi:30S ribosomal protein S13 [Candidatus Altiarchaeales archaeon WOR_SM1_SCG]|nr:30S ribosomal protein S13 [Candidatus Altiarchaeales archaeon WOR_SM1_SCG]
MPKSKQKSTQKSKKDKEFRHLVRVLGVIVDGNLTVQKALMKIKGVGPQISHSLNYIADLPVDTKIGDLSDEEIEEIEGTIENLNKHLPHWMLNRQRDLETGGDIHLITADLDMTLREDINRMKKIKSYKGVRHGVGLPVRGQRTRSTFRHGTTMGVTRKKLQK